MLFDEIKDSTRVRPGPGDRIQERLIETSINKLNTVTKKTTDFRYSDTKHVQYGFYELRIKNLLFSAQYSSFGKKINIQVFFTKNLSIALKLFYK